MSKINIPLKFGLKGTIKSIKLIDTRTGKIDDERKNIKNMHLDDYLDKLLTGFDVSDYSGPLFLGFDLSLSLINYFLPFYCHIGSDDTPPQRSDSVVLSEIANVEYSSFAHSSIGDNPMWHEFTYKFLAGVGSGTIRELGIASSTKSIEIARQILDNPIVKEDYHELEVTWRRELEIPQSQTWSGTITGGQKDGTTDINWEISMNNQQFYQFASGGRYKEINSDYNYNFFASLFGFGQIASQNYIIVGDSNLPSDIANDGAYTIKGNQIYAGDVPIKEPQIYENGSYQRTSRQGFDAADVNSPIGEIVFTTARDAAGTTKYDNTGIFRMTFNPKLDKTSNYRLYLDITVSLNPS